MATTLSSPVHAPLKERNTWVSLNSKLFLHPSGLCQERHNVSWYCRKKKFSFIPTIGWELTLLKSNKLLTTYRTGHLSRRKGVVHQIIRVGILQGTGVFLNLIFHSFWILKWMARLRPWDITMTCTLDTSQSVLKWGCLDFRIKSANLMHCSDCTHTS